MPLPEPTVTLSVDTLNELLRLALLGKQFERIHPYIGTLVLPKEDGRCEHDWSGASLTGKAGGTTPSTARVRYLYPASVGSVTLPNGLSREG